MKRVIFGALWGSQISIKHSQPLCFRNHRHPTRRNLQSDRALLLKKVDRQGAELETFYYFQLFKAF